VRGVDLKYPEFQETTADEFIQGDLRDPRFVSVVMTAPDQIKMGSGGFDEVYQLAADMGGAGYIFTGDHDADVMHNSATINLNVADQCRDKGVGKVFYSSSACMYPEHNQLDPDNPNCEESSAYPANPDSEYGWEKLFSERLYLSYNRNYNLNVRIARFHNIYGPYGTYDGGREKAPAAICRKVITSPDDSIEIWGDGSQTRSFLYIDECIEAVRRLMESDFIDPVNIGSDEMVTINQLVDMAEAVEGKKLNRRYKLDAPTGVPGRNSCNKLIKDKLGWSPNYSLQEGINNTYKWIKSRYN
jgi:nucleoside-diphosphate-sugar epimerase